MSNSQDIDDSDSDHVILERLLRMPSPPAPSTGNLSEGQRRHAARRAARRNATKEEIASKGIRPLPRSLLNSMNEAALQPVKGIRFDGSTARKIFSEVPSHPQKRRIDETEDDDDKTNESKIDAEIAIKWCDYAQKYGSLRNISYSEQVKLRREMRDKILQIRRVNVDWRAAQRSEAAKISTPKVTNFDLIGSLSTCTDLMVEVCKHLKPKDILNVYSISRRFHNAVNRDFKRIMGYWSMIMAPNATPIFSGDSYQHVFVNDPTAAAWALVKQGRDQGMLSPGTNTGNKPTSSVPEATAPKVAGFSWLQMVVNREIRIRDIIASLARNGHRLMPGTNKVLLKLWLVMDVATSKGRAILLRNKDLFTDDELYKAQLFFVKLAMLFNDPVRGDVSLNVMKLMMGQKSFSPLWALLRGKKYTEYKDIEKLKIMYDVGPTTDQLIAGGPVEGVPVDKMGILHLEGWGTGDWHLMRPDEVLWFEATRDGRDLDLDRCIETMMIYGHVDIATGCPQVPSLDEMYMSDDELGPLEEVHEDTMSYALINGGCGNVPFDPNMWQPKHARKARWSTLSEEERKMILEAEEAEIAEDKGWDRWKDDLDSAVRELGESIKLYEMGKEPVVLTFPFEDDDQDEDDDRDGGDDDQDGDDEFDDDADTNEWDPDLDVMDLERADTAIRDPATTLLSMSELQKRPPVGTNAWMKGDNYDVALDAGLLAQGEDSDFNDLGSEELEFDWDMHLHATRQGYEDEADWREEIAKQGRKIEEEDGRTAYLRDYYRAYEI